MYFVYFCWRGIYTRCGWCIDMHCHHQVSLMLFHPHRPLTVFLHFVHYFHLMLPHSLLFFPTIFFLVKKITQRIVYIEYLDFSNHLYDCILGVYMSFLNRSNKTSFIRLNTIYNMLLTLLTFFVFM